MWESFKGRHPESGSLLKVDQLPAALVGVNSSIAQRADACTRRCEATAGCNAVVVPRFIGSRAHQRCHLHASVTMGLSKPTTHNDTYRLVSTSKSIPPPQGPQVQLAADGVSIAICVTGVASHAAADKAEKPGLHSFPIHDARTYRGMAAWRARLRSLRVRTEVFLVLDTALGWAPRTGWRSVRQVEEQHKGGSKWRQVVNHTSRATLQPMMQALEPTAFVEYTQPPRCQMFTCFSSCPPLSPPALNSRLPSHLHPFDHFMSAQVLDASKKARQRECIRS